MKPASAATLANLASGQTKRIDLYAFTLAGGAPTYYYTSHQVPVIVAGQLYQTGLILKRGPKKQTVGLEVQSMQVTCTPQMDNSSGPPTINGFPFLTACAMGLFNSARLLYSKMFLSSFDDLTPGAVPDFQGRVNRPVIDRFSAVLSINSDIEMLNVAAPPNIVQQQCMHTWADAGCGLSPAAFGINGTVASGSTVVSVNTSLTQPDKYFTLGRVTFLTGANATSPRTTFFVKDYLNAGGQLQLIKPLANVPQAGDTFLALPGCPKTMPACSNTNVAVGPPFNNRKRFRGLRFVPVPETLYDGGASQVPMPSLGSQGGAGTPFGSGGGLRGSYKP